MSEHAPRTTMADNYPAGMSECYRVGMSGGCGEDCPAYISGDCDCENEILKHASPAQLKYEQSLLFETELT